MFKSHVLSPIILSLTCKSSSPYKITLPNTTFLHIVSVLSILIAVGAAVSYPHTDLLQTFIKPVMIVTSFFTSVALFVPTILAFVGSFI